MAFAYAVAEVNVESVKYGSELFKLRPSGKYCDKIFIISFYDSYRKDEIYKIVSAPNILRAAEIAAEDSNVIARLHAGGRVYIIGGDGEVFVMEK